MATFKSVLEQFCLGISDFVVTCINLIMDVMAIFGSFLEDFFLTIVDLVSKKKQEIISTKIKSNYMLKFNQLKNTSSSRPINLNNCYNFMHAKRGIALIFNHEHFINENCPEREGTKRDGDNLKAALEELKFEVRDYMDLKLHEIKNVLWKVSNEDHSNNDCLWVTVMSHGGRDGKIYSSDKHYQVEELLKNFLGNKCKSLIGKPKLFFIQACRGNLVVPNYFFNQNSDTEQNNSTVDSAGTSNIHADLLVMYSTLDGCFAFRNKLNGSWFILVLSQELQKMKKNEGDLIKVLTDVINRVDKMISKSPNEKESATKKQLPKYESTLTKTVLLSYESSNQECIQQNRFTDNIAYDTSNAKRGIALIFNHEKFINNNFSDRRETRKDGDDLKAVLQELQFIVRIHIDLTLQEIRNVLYEVSLEDHSNNDCLWVTVISNGGKDGKISAADEDYNVEELWENFLGDKCESLIGKPKLFFIDASRGSMVDSGVLQRNKPIRSEEGRRRLLQVIPKYADLLVMYSTAEGHSAFRNQGSGSWFIQALCEELKTNPQEDLLRILTGVNRRVAFTKQSHIPGNERWDAKKQILNIKSMLTKLIFLHQNPARITKDLSYDFSNAKRGLALIFNHETFKDPVHTERKGTKKDGDDLKAVLKELQFDVRVYMDLTLDEIRKVLDELSKEDYSNNDCLWVTVMSHGGKDGIISAADKDYNVEELWENFFGDKCESLIGKPKLFFIQACRGSMVDSGVIKIKKLPRSEVRKRSTELVIPESDDLLIMYSTKKGVASDQSDIHGSWFIQDLCCVLDNERNDLLSNVKTLENAISHGNNLKEIGVSGQMPKNQMPQMPFIVSTLNNMIFFHNNPSGKTHYSFFHGIALIFNYNTFGSKLRQAGAKKDGDDLKNVLEELQFDVRVHMNLKINEIIDTLYDVSQEDHSNNDCLLVAVISHGTVNGKIVASDEEYYVQELWDDFIGDNCESLNGKPKLFFIQAYGGCLGDDDVSLNMVDCQLEESNANESMTKLTQSEDPVIPNRADVLVMHSSAYGHISTRHMLKGAWFIQALCEELKTKPQDDLMHILTRISGRVAFTHVQMPCIMSMLTKEFNFPRK